LRSQI
jgi:hypothetical protein